MSHLDDWAAALVDGELAADERDRAVAHLAGCAQCRAEVEVQRRAKAALSGAATPAPGDALTARLLGVPATVPTAPTAPTAPSVPPSDVVRGATAGSRGPAGLRPRRGARPVPARPARRRRVAAGSAGIAAAALAVAAYAGSNPPGDVAPPVGTFVVEHTATTTQLPLHDPAAGIVMISTR